MALDKLVDSTEIDSGLTTIANAIRTKGGTSEQLSFPQGMAEAIAAMSGGIDASPYIITFKKITVVSDSTTFTFPLDLPNATSTNTPIVYIFNPNWATDRSTETWRAYGAANLSDTNNGNLASRNRVIWTDEGSGGTNQGWIVRDTNIGFVNGDVVFENTKSCKWLAGSTYYCFAITLKDW